MTGGRNEYKRGVNDFRTSDHITARQPVSQTSIVSIAFLLLLLLFVKMTSKIDGHYEKQNLYLCIPMYVCVFMCVCV